MTHPVNRLPSPDRLLLIEATDDDDVADIVTVLTECTAWSTGRLDLGPDGGRA